MGPDAFVCMENYNTNLWLCQRGFAIYRDKTFKTGLCPVGASPLFKTGRFVV